MKKYFKKLLVSALVGAVVASNVYMFTSDVIASNDGKIVSVYIDNTPAQFKNSQAVMVGGVTMVPFRDLAYALGIENKDIIWKDDTKKITLMKNGKYAVLQMGKNYMTNGTYKIDITGDPAPETSNTTEIARAPFIKDGFSLVPVTAISTAFNSDYKYDATSNSLYITTRKSSTVSQAPKATTEPSPSVVAPVPTHLVDVAFSDTTYFKEVSASHVQQMHDGKMKFAVTIYDSKNSASKAGIEMIKRAAEQTKWKVYGFDTSSTKYQNSEKLKWVWEHVDRYAANYPIIIFSYEGEKDWVAPTNITFDQLVKKLENIKLDYPLYQDVSPSATPTPSQSALPSTTPSASPSASPSATNSSNYSQLKFEKLEDKKKEKETFVYVIYHTRAGEDFSSTIGYIKEAASQAGVKVYYNDLKDESVNVDWFGKDDITASTQFPITFVFKNGERVEQTLAAYSSVASYLSSIKEYIK